MPDTHSSLPDLHRDVINAAQNKKLLPIVAAGVSMSVLDENNKPLFPSWKATLQTASKYLSESDASDKKLAAAIDAMLGMGDYQKAADYARQGLKGHSWNTFFDEQFDKDLIGLDLTLAQAIWQISQSIITLNYDRVMSKACEQGLSVYDNRSRTELSRFGDKDKCELWHLHGRVDNKNDIIFTSESYDTLYNENAELAKDYKAAIKRLESLSTSHHFLFIGCSMDDAELIEKLAQQNKIFADSTGPHFVMVREDSKNDLEAKLAHCGVNFVYVPYADFGQPLLDKVNQIVDACQPIATPISVIPTASAPASMKAMALNVSQNEPCKIAILHPQMVDHQLDCTDVMNELKKIKADLYFYPLNQQRLNNLDGMDYVIMVSEALDDSLLIEGDYLCRDKMPLDDIIDNIGGGSGHKGVIVITDKPLVTSVLSTIDEPVIVLPTFDKKVIKAATFQLFNKHRKPFTFYEYIQSVNTESFELTQLSQKNISNIIDCKTPLPSDVSPTLLQHTIGRLDNIETIVRKTIKLTDIAADGCLTIKGAGGLGKTTLAKKVVVALARDGRYRQGIYFIDASTIVDFTDFENNIMQPFGLEGVQDALIELNKLYSVEHNTNGTLSEQRLIVVDNAETLKHLADSERILRLLADICQFCTLLATSREVLGVEYGVAYELRQFSTDEAEALFYQQSPLKKLNNADRRILRRDILEQLLDNHPLAVKIVAKATFSSDSVTTLRKKLLKSDELFELENLEESHHPSDGNIERQRTVFKCIAYSYEQLKPEEQNIFKMLALFPDGLPSEQLQRISSEQKPNQQDERYQSIKKQYIKALQNKSLIEESDGVQKLHAIVRRFAEKKIEQDPNAAILYKKAFKHNKVLADNIRSQRNEGYQNRSIQNARVNSIQNNLISTLKYFGLYNYDVEDQIEYIHLFGVILQECNCREQQISTLQSLLKRFVQDERVCLFIRMKLLWLRYYDGEFAEVYALLQKTLSIANALELDYSNINNRYMALNAADIYKMEGNVIGAIEIQNFFYSGGYGFFLNAYPEELFVLGEFDSELLKFVGHDLSYFLLQSALNALNINQLMYYFHDTYEKSYIQRMQIYSLLSKSIDVDVEVLDSLLVVNPYTAGLKQLMLLKLESNPETVNKLYQQALDNLFHIKYYYVEALLDYCRFLKTYDIEKYTEQLAIGLQLAEKHYYRYLQHQFIQLRDDTDEPYNANNYVLPDGLPLAEYKALVLKDFKSNLKKKR